MTGWKRVQQGGGMRRWLQGPSIKVMSLLFMALVVINGASVIGIVSSRHSAESLAKKDLTLQTTVHARSLEAVLSSRRGDFIFLSQSSPLVDAPTALAASNPIDRRWGRLDIEGSLLLYLNGHPDVQRLAIRDSGGRPLVVAGRREGAPVLLPPGDYSGDSEGMLVGKWQLRASQGPPGVLEAVLDIDRLLDIAAPGLGPEFSLVPEDVFDPALLHGESGDSLVVSMPVRDESWPQPICWILVCRQPNSNLLHSFTALAGRYRTTVILNLIIMSAALVLGVFAFQQVRRTAALKAENRQQEKVRELERRVLHNERLASVGRLAAGMAHEINNPLEGMANYLGLLEDDLRRGRTAASLELVQRAREGLERVAGIIRQVLTFSDPGHGQLARVDVNDVLNEAVSFVRSNPSFRRTGFTLNPCLGEVPVMGNRVTLGQLFLNLLMNASQVQPEGGQIEIASLKQEGKAVVIVADCGPGIPAEVLPRMFEPFFSTRGSTGLGLSVCHGIATEHGGRLWAENRMEGGAMFFVELPLSAAEAERESKPSAESVEVAAKQHLRGQS
jgi:signal transduction histidine kinase